MNHECACTRPIQDTAVVCPHCAHILDAALAEVTEWLAAELDVTLSKQTRVAVGHGLPQPEEPQAKAPGTLKPNPLPYHGGASNAATNLKATLVSWACIVRDEAGADLPAADTIASVAAWMRPRVGWLRYHDAGQDAVDEICAAVAQARRVIDRPAERLYAGPCDCGADLYARLDSAYVTCQAEAHEEGPLVWPVEDRRRWLLRSAEDVLATTAEISRALTRYAQPVTPSKIRGLKARGRLAQRGTRVENGKEVALWRLGDVLDAVAPEQEKVSA